LSIIELLKYYYTVFMKRFIDERVKILPEEHQIVVSACVEFYLSLPKSQHQGHKEAIPRSHFHFKNTKDTIPFNNNVLKW